MALTPAACRAAWSRSWTHSTASIDRIRLLPLERCHSDAIVPELNPVETIWLYLRERWLSHRVLAGGYGVVVDVACVAWNALRAEPGRLRFLTSFPWLPGSVQTW